MTFSSLIFQRSFSHSSWLFIVLLIATTHSAHAQAVVAVDDLLVAVEGKHRRVALDELLANDQIPDPDPQEYEFAGSMRVVLEIVTPPQYGELIPDRLESDIYYYSLTAESIQHAVGQEDSFTYRLTHQDGFSNTATVRVRFRPRFVPLVGNWRSYVFPGQTCVDEGDELGWYNSATSTFNLCDFIEGVAIGLFCLELHAPQETQGWTPVVGDWDGDSWDEVGLYDPVTATFQLFSFSPNSCPVLGEEPPLTTHALFSHGEPGAMPIAGDWNGDGVDTVGLYDPWTQQFELLDTNVDAATSSTFSFGQPYWAAQPLVGDWGSGYEEVALYDRLSRGFFHPSCGNIEEADPCFTVPHTAGQSHLFSASGQPFAGRWLEGGDIRSSIGYFDPYAPAEFNLYNFYDDGRGPRHVKVPVDPD